MVDSLNEIPSLMGSKYVQSDTSRIFKQVEKKLRESTKPILFVGTPCQVAGLNSFLRKKYENLYTVDLVCHGVPSPALWKKYVAYLEEKYQTNLAQYRFRSKKYSWTFFHQEIIFNNGKEIVRDWFKSKWMRLFLSNKALRKSCYECNYTSMERGADITLADFWGYKYEKKEERNTDEGISMVLVNTLLGDSLINKIKDNIYISERSLNVISKSQKSLSSPWESPEGRILFWNDYNMLPFNQFLDKYTVPAKAMDIGSLFAKYGMIRIGLYIRWNIVNRLKKIIKRYTIKNEVV